MLVYDPLGPQETTCWSDISIIKLVTVNSKGPTKHSDAGEHENNPNPDDLLLLKDIIPLGAKKSQ